MAGADDEVREIQLSGKQLVFLFMAVTVVSVVIFLFGVLVGRGVQTRATTAAGAPQTAAIEEPADPTAPAAPPAEAPTTPTKTPDLGFQDRLERKTPPPETVGTRPDPPPAAKAAPSAPVPSGTAPAASSTPAALNAPVTPVPTSTPAANAAVPAAYAEPKGDGFAIQVAALTGRTEAEAVAARLKGKGYAVYLVAALPGQPAGFKVRVGKFKARADAEKIATRLEREEQFKPWITR